MHVEGGVLARIVYYLKVVYNLGPGPAVLGTTDVDGSWSGLGRAVRYRFGSERELHALVAVSQNNIEADVSPGLRLEEGGQT